MDSTQRTQAEKLLRQALILEPSRRTAFLAEIQNLELRLEVESLLSANDMPPDVTAELPLAELARSIRADPSRSLPGEEEFGGRFRILRALGEGGMGTVYLAEQRVPVRRNVALKLIRPGMDSGELLARFEAERQTLALMDHPNIAKVLDAGQTTSGRPYFVMEAVEGAPITEYCDTHHLTVRERLDLFRPVCQALQQAHQKGIIHRDVKPSNVLVATYDGRPVPKVIDFGLAKAMEQPLIDRPSVTRIGTVVGTLQYMSPEQAQSGGTDLDTRSDIYSLGVLLYELFTGTTPLVPEELAKAGFAAVLRHISEAEPPPPSVRLKASHEMLARASAQRSIDGSRLTKMLEQDLDWITMKALEKDPARRYPTANALIRDIERYLLGEPVEASPPSRTYRVRKFAYRHRALLTTVTGLAVLLVLAAAISSWQAIQAKRERDRAVAALHEANAGRLAAHAMESLAVNPERSIALALYAVNATLSFGQAVTATANNALHAAVLASAVRLGLRGHTARVTGIAISPDGTRIATASEDKTAKVWDAASGRNLLTLRGHQDWVLGLSYSPDGKRISTGGADRTARIWDAATGRELLKLSGSEHTVRNVAFSPDGKYLAGASIDKTARVWDSTTGRMVRILRHEQPVFFVRFTTDGRRLITLSLRVMDFSSNALETVWDVRTGQSLREIPIGKGLMISGDLSSNAKLWATIDAASPGGRSGMRLWDAETGRQVLLIEGQRAPKTDVALTGDGRHMITGDANGELCLWDLSTGVEILTLHGNGAPVRGIALGHDSKPLVTSSGSSATIWDLASGGETPSLRSEAGPVRSIAFSPDGSGIATCSQNATLIWDAGSGRELLRLPLHGGLAAAFSPDGKLVATAGTTATLWESATGRELRTLNGHNGRVWSVTFTPDGRRVVTGSMDKTAKLWDRVTGHELLTLRGHEGYVWTVAVSPNGEQIATGASDSTARLWNAETGRELLRLRHKSQVRGVAFSPDGRRLATASEDGTARLWETTTGRELRTFRGHEGEVAAVAFSPDGKKIGTASWDKTARVWDAETGQALLTLRNSRPQMSIAFDRNGKRLAVGDDIGVVERYILDIRELMALARGRVTRPLTPAECEAYLGSDTCPPLP